VDVGTGHVLRCSDLLQVEVSQARVSQFASKLGRRDDEWCMWHHHKGCVRVKSKTDDVGPYYPRFAVFVIFVPRGSVVI
jgi:hypothetical protein